jgi:hypothetical protein
VSDYDDYTITELIDRITELEAEPRRLAGLLADNVDRIAELKSQRSTQDTVVKTLEGEKRYLQAQLKAVRECQRYGQMGRALIKMPDGQVMLSEDVIKAAQEAGE